MKQYLYNLATDKNKSFFASGIKFILLLFSFIYGLIIRGLIFISSFDLKRFDLRVISIGNITLGGTGKTTLVALIATYLKQQGHKVAILSRGYKRMSSRFSVLGSRPNTEHRTPNTETMGDEPRMLFENLGDVPVIVDKDRARGAKRAIREYNSDTVILDDGMQQWGIKKDLEIVTIDALNPFGNGQMIPRGILRQPLSSLRQADIFVLTKTNLTEQSESFSDFPTAHPEERSDEGSHEILQPFGLQDDPSGKSKKKNSPRGHLNKIKSVLSKYNPKALVVESIHNPTGFYDIKKPGELLNLGYLKGKKIALFSGIGDPDSFLKLILSLDIKVGLDLRFSDHHNYTLEELEAIVRKVSKEGLNIIVTTEKDAARFSNETLGIFGNLKLLVLRVELKIVKNEELLLGRLFRLYSF